jgi:hypothetical protein
MKKLTIGLLCQMSRTHPTIEIDMVSFSALKKASLTRENWPIPMFCPTIAVNEAPIPMAGCIISEVILFTMPKAARVVVPYDTIKPLRKINPRAAPDCPIVDGRATLNNFLVITISNLKFLKLGFIFDGDL